MDKELAPLTITKEWGPILTWVSTHKGQYSHRSVLTRVSTHTGQYSHRSVLTRVSTHMGQYSHGSVLTQVSTHTGQYSLGQYSQGSVLTGSVLTASVLTRVSTHTGTGCRSTAPASSPRRGRRFARGTRPPSGRRGRRRPPSGRRSAPTRSPSPGIAEDRDAAASTTSTEGQLRRRQPNLNYVGVN